LLAHQKGEKPPPSVSGSSPPAVRGIGAGDADTTTAIPSSLEESKWAARLVGAGSLLTLVYQLAYLGFDRRWLWTSHGWPLFLHLLNIGLFFVAVVMTLRVGPWMRRHWKAVAFSFSTILITSSMWLTIITGDSEPLSVALMLFLAGTGPFLSWGEWIQGLLSLVAIVAFTIAVADLPSARSDPYQWLGIFIAAAIGLFSTALERRLHRARRRAENEALRSRELLISQERIRVAGQLAAGIAHDLNNTLNVVKLRLAALLSDNGILSQHEVVLRIIERAVEDAALTVARIRELGRSREQAGSESSQPYEVIAEALDLVRTTIEGTSSLENNPIRIISHISEPLPRVKGSASELRQVFVNVLLNAYEAIHREGEIIIDATLREDTVIVTVSDTGPGIAPEQLERIFDPFFTTKGPRGTGLGLSIGKNIVESFGGHITASNASNGGAVFTLEFPVASNSARDDQENLPAKLPASCRFLLIDDDVQNVDALKEVLQLRGHHADTATSGSEALEKLSLPSVYDMVLCDLAMPGMNGWEVARAALQADPKLNFYIVTGWGEHMESEIPANLPVQGVLSKPIDLTKLDRLAALVKSKPCSLLTAG
jgi:signal transduction histidine kinase/CheY-like chemotaxis protein